MNKILRILYVLWICYFLVACGSFSDVSTSETIASTLPSLTPQVPILTPLPTIDANTATTPVDTSIISTETPIGTFKDYDVVLNIEHEPDEILYFDMHPNGNIWILKAQEKGGILTVYNGERPVDESHLDEIIYRVSDFAVTESDIWIIDSDADQQSGYRVVRLDLFGNLINTYIIPDELVFGPKGEYEFSTVEFTCETEGRLELESAVGVFQLLDANGKVDFKPQEGCIYDGHLYRVDWSTFESGAKSGTVMIDDSKIEISTELDEIVFNLAGIAPDGSFYVISHEYLKDYPFSDLLQYNRFVVRHYSSVGDSLGISLAPQFAPHIVGSDGGFYILIPSSENLSQIRRLIFGQELHIPTVPPSFVNTPTGSVPEQDN